MGMIVRCDHCGSHAQPGQQWIRVRMEPFYPSRISGPSYGPEVACAPDYHEGMSAEVCSPGCAASALADQAQLLCAGYSQLAHDLAGTAKLLEG